MIVFGCCKTAKFSFRENIILDSRKPRVWLFSIFFLSSLKTFVSIRCSDFFAQPISTFFDPIKFLKVRKKRKLKFSGSSSFRLNRKKIRSNPDFFFKKNLNRNLFSDSFSIFGQTEIFSELVGSVPRKKKFRKKVFQSCDFLRKS